MSVNRNGAFGIGAAAKSLIDFDEKITAIGVQAGQTDAEINRLKKDIFAVANSPNVKPDVTSIRDAIAEIADLTGDEGFTRDNLKLTSTALRAIGGAGADTGGLPALFRRANISGGELNKTLGTMVNIANNGAFTAKDMAAPGPACSAPASPRAARLSSRSKTPRRRRK